MHSERARAALVDILRNIELAESFVRDVTPEQFADDVLRVYATTRALEVISEASRRLPDDLKANYLSVPNRLRLEDLEVPAWMEEQAWRLRYNKRVFIAPPWREIFGNDEERRQSWSVAVRTYEIMVETYSDYGYELIEVPRAPVEERVEFMMGEIRRSER
jgi:DNA polymerase III psi subunit